MGWTCCWSVNKNWIDFARDTVHAGKMTLILHIHTKCMHKLVCMHAYVHTYNCMYTLIDIGPVFTALLSTISVLHTSCTDTHIYINVYPAHPAITTVPKQTQKSGAWPAPIKLTYHCQHGRQTLLNDDKFFFSSPNMATFWVMNQYVYLHPIVWPVSNITQISSQ